MSLAKSLTIATVVLLSITRSALAGKHDEDQLVVTTMKRAAAKDVKGLIELQGQAISSPADRYAYHLARYVADPKGYGAIFVSEFPASSSGVMGYVYKLELARGDDGSRLTPTFLYAFDQLGNLAISGNPEAVEKLFMVTNYSDGVVTEFVCEKVAQVIARDVTLALDKLSKLNIFQRQRVYKCFGASSANEISSRRQAMVKQQQGKYSNIVQEVIGALDSAY